MTVQNFILTHNQTWVMSDAPIFVANAFLSHMAANTTVIATIRASLNDRPLLLVPFMEELVSER